MNFKHALLTAGLLASAAAHAQLVVGVSWSNFQEERWKTDEAAIKAELAKHGATYVSADAGGSPEKQLADVDGLIAKGAKALIVLAMDKDAIVPALAKAKQRNIPVIAYDRLIEQPGVYYITFDNKEVGRMQARGVFSVKPRGNYVMIKGSPTDPNADFLREGQQEVLDAAIKSGAIKIVGEEYTEGWKPEVAQKNMEQILTRNGNKVDAVVASNDGTAGGVVAALSARGISGVPVSGQDGDQAALNRVALGTQTVSVWKDARDLGREAADAAVDLASGKPVPGTTKWSGGEHKVQMDAKFLKPVPISRANLETVVKAGWITKDNLCRGVDAAKAPAACK
ncbi:D-xylose ABC transporter substrate-binding protein [Scleromatobacter humisilvae]|uniref:D-xylose-binding periplasmic protein n=1 Tax=Scleromatobacter humisilvae TaxID=2897159 RepID=A0A9X2C3D8_9BURK|nr:D-xylose ABC transporter substrate-binding protein [Scleromatobacter humisilvae]MCK9687964.1 D-xylose ABC transporter substrate-binding protein [Scleromatobacter humisilvae]